MTRCYGCNRPTGRDASMAIAFRHPDGSEWSRRLVCAWCHRAWRGTQ